MNYVFILLILGLCGGGYYEYTTFQQKSAADQQQITDLQTKIDAIQADDKKMTDENVQLTKTVSDDQGKIVELTQQIQTAQAAIQAAKQAVPAPVTTTTSAAPPPSTPSNDLGTITTLDGKTYPGSQLLKVQADSIVVNYSGGITQIPFSLMPPALQKRFNYDPQQAAALTEAQIEFQEQQRKAAAGMSGN